jgi:hypothetical protein
LKTSIVVYPGAKYARIIDGSRDVSMLIEHTHVSVAESLRISAAEMRADALRLTRRAEFIDAAALQFEVQA